MQREYMAGNVLILRPHPERPAMEKLEAQTEEEFVKECFEWDEFKNLFPDVETIEDVRALVTGRIIVHKGKID